MKKTKVNVDVCEYYSGFYARVSPFGYAGQVSGTQGNAVDLLKQALIVQRDQVKASLEAVKQYQSERKKKFKKAAKHVLKVHGNLLKRLGPE